MFCRVHIERHVFPKVFLELAEFPHNLDVAVGASDEKGGTARLVPHVRWKGFSVFGVSPQDVGPNSAADDSDHFQVTLTACHVERSVVFVVCRKHQPRGVIEEGLSYPVVSSLTGDVDG